MSCFKFDGYASDGKRIMMRDCGYFNTDDCVANQGSRRRKEIKLSAKCMYLYVLEKNT
jgi:hypothetical protein